ncbi:PREDICTED: esterase OVCA2-like isoform X1 [Camelina sativa]|uniref:Esterase OVCA2-like isoform X1 n=1 Tax=Camelina sativa TaxID=90675 RepID=A0ABM0TZT0_CAMSA|nr:PREDICTED: esterase OVCA2-like isoform X1 [Camelina sativa]
MGSKGGSSILRKPRFLCLHGFRTSGEKMKKQLHKWPKSVIGRLELVFLDAPFPCRGKSDYDGIYDPPYYEWYQYNKEFTVYTNLEKCFEFLEDRMVKLGPFDGLIGFSQGAILSGALLGMQAKGIAFQKVPKIKFVIIIGGAMFKSTKMRENAYSSSLDTLSLHILGEKDFVKHSGIKLTELFQNPVVVHHSKGHTVPRLDDKSLENVTRFIDTIEHLVMEEDKKNGEETNSTSIGQIMGRL